MLRHSLCLLRSMLDHSSHWHGACAHSPDPPLPLCIASPSRPEEPSTWSGYMGKMFMAATNYLPAQVSDMMNQDRAFATGRLNFSGQKNICTLSTYVQGWEDGSAVISPSCSCREPGFSTHIRWLITAYNSSWGCVCLTPSPGRCTHCMYVVHMQTSRHTLMHIARNKEKQNSPREGHVKAICLLALRWILRGQLGVGM